MSELSQIRKIQEIEGNTAQIASFFTPLSRANIKRLGKALAKNTSLQTLKISGQTLNGEVAERVFPALVGHPSIQVMEYSTSGQFSGESLQYLTDFLRQNRSLEALSLESCRIDDPKAAKLADALRGHPTLQKLFLPKNQIGPEGAATLAELLPPNTNIRQLSLLGCEIGNAGAEAIARKLDEGAPLSILYLSECGIGDAGAKALAHSLANGAPLTALSLHRNDLITSAGIKALCNGVAFHSRMASLGLNVPQDSSSPETLRAITQPALRNPYHNLTESLPQALAEANPDLAGRIRDNRADVQHMLNLASKLPASAMLDYFVEIQRLETAFRKQGADAENTYAAMLELLPKMPPLPQTHEERGAFMTALFTPDETTGLSPLDNPRLWEGQPLSMVRELPLNRATLLRTAPSGKMLVESLLEGFPAVALVHMLNGKGIGIQSRDLRQDGDFTRVFHAFARVPRGISSLFQTSNIAGDHTGMRLLYQHLPVPSVVQNSAALGATAIFHTGRGR